MCENRFWKNLYPTVIKNNSFNILARRSDGVDITIPVSFDLDYNNSGVIDLEMNIFRKAILLIESYRICECTSEISCSKHKIRSRK